MEKEISTNPRERSKEMKVLGSIKKEEKLSSRGQRGHVQFVKEIYKNKLTNNCGETVSSCKIVHTKIIIKKKKKVLPQF